MTPYGDVFSSSPLSGGALPSLTSPCHLEYRPVPAVRNASGRHLARCVGCGAFSSLCTCAPPQPVESSPSHDSPPSSHTVSVAGKV